MDKVIQLQDREGNNLYPISADGITKSRSVLISGVRSYNTETVSSGTPVLVTGTDATKYKQFGPQAKDSGQLATIKVTVPEGETWTIKVNLSVPILRVNSGSIKNTFVNLVEMSTDGSTTGARWFSTRNAYHTYGMGFSMFDIITLEAGTYYYGVTMFSEGGTMLQFITNGVEAGTTAPVYSAANTGPSYTLTAELLEKSGEELNTTIKPTPAYNIGLGTVLAYAEKTNTTATSTTALTVWKTGNWAQYGPLKNSEKPWCVSLTAPAGEDWWVKLDASAGKFRANTTSSSGLGIAEVDSTGTAILYLDGSVSSSDSAEYGSSVARCMVKIPAGTTKNFAIYTYGNCTIEGAGPVTTHVWNAGRQVVLTATLLDKASA